MIRSKILIIAVLGLLSVSLAGNFFAIGHLAHEWRSGPSAFSMSLEASYSPEVQSAFRDILRKNRTVVRVALAELRAARSNQETLARQHPMDEAAMRAAMAEVRAKTTKLQVILQDYLIIAIQNTGSL